MGSHSRYYAITAAVIYMEKLFSRVISIVLHNGPLKREKRPNPMPNQPKITGHLMVHWLVCLKMQLYPGCYTWCTMRPIYLIEVCHAGNAG